MATRIGGGGGKRTRRKSSGPKLKDLKPIKGAKLSPELERVVTRPTSRTRPQKPSPKPARKAPPKHKETVVRVKVKPKRDKTIADVAAEARLARQVDVAIKRRGKGDTGDILKGTTVVRKREADALKRELEGKGKAAEISEKAGKAVAPGLSMAAGMVPIPGFRKFSERLVKDVINLPAQAVPSLYVPIAAGVEAARGNPKRLKRLGKDIQESDPIYATGEGVVKTFSGDPKGGKKSFERALKLANKHPGFTAVEVVGVKGTAGRGVTRAQKVAGRKPPKRAPAVVPGTDLVQPRAYSKDAFTRRRQQKQDKEAAARSTRLRTMAEGLEKKDPERNAERIDELRRAATAGRISRLPNPRLAVEGETMRPGRLADPSRMTEAEIRKRAAERVAVNEVVRRENRTKVGQEVNRAISPSRGKLKGRQTASAAHTLAVQGITDFSRKDLAAYKREIAEQYQGLGESGRKANRKLQHEIQKAIDSDPDPVVLREQVRRYAEIVKPRTQALVDRGMLPAASADKAPLVPYAVRRMGAEVTDDGPVHPKTGELIRAKEIRAHMKAHGVDEPVYVTQSPSQGGSSAFYVSSNKPQSVPNVRRTGGATAKGTFNARPEVLAESAARAQGLIDAADGFAATVKEFAHRKPGEKRPATFGTKLKADQAARELSAKSGVEFRPIRLSPFAGRQEQLQALLDQAGEGGTEQTLGKLQPVREALEGAYRGEEGPGPWALIPRTAADEFAAHMAKQGTGPAAKVAQLVGQSFRRAVLSTSPTWFAGNLVEASLRSVLAGAGPKSYKLGRDVLKQVDELSPKLGQELRARATGGGHFRSADTLHIRRGAEQFEGSTVEPMARALHKFWSAPGPRQVAGAWNAWTDIVFRQLNGRIESQYQTAMLGRALRDSPLMDNDLPKLSAKAVEQAARGLTNTNEQAALARRVERMYGKYNGFTAGTRWAIAMYTPFIPWTLNAIRFVYDVLPRDHPTVTGLIAASEQWSEEWRKDHGLDLFMDEAVPGFLQGSIPLKGGGHQRAPYRYTPFGAFGDPLDTVAKAVLPQYQGVLAAFKGEDWKGSKLRGPNGEELDVLGKARAAAMSFTEATVPLVGIVKRVAEKGPATLNPVNPVKPPKPKVRAGGGGGDIDSYIDEALSGGGGVDEYLDAALGGTP